jgi:rubrerythrin
MAEDLTLRECIQLAVTTEEIGCKFYERLARKFADDKDIADIFSQLAKDEKAHEKQFKLLLEKVPKEELQPEKYELHQFLRATAISEFFRKDYFKQADEISTPSDALGKALAFEKATLLYYQAIRDVLGENKQLDAIIKAERNHVMAIARVVVTDARFRGLSDSV